jgi:hypothetical protein
MAQLSSKIRIYLDREVDFTKDVRLQDDGDGAYIKEWNVAEVQPTEEQLNAFESEADAVEALNQVYANRKAEYPDIYDYMDGIVKSDQAQIDKYIADCQAVKDKYSKGV